MRSYVASHRVADKERSGMDPNILLYAGYVLRYVILYLSCLTNSSRQLEAICKAIPRKRLPSIEEITTWKVS